MIAGAVIGIVILSAFSSALTGFNVNGQFLFPCSLLQLPAVLLQFHSLVGSGTTSKQLDNEKDTRLIGYGAMLIKAY